MKNIKKNHYLVHGKVFKTIEEASCYADDYLKSTRVVLCVTATERKVTHRYRLSWMEE